MGDINYISRKGGTIMLIEGHQYYKLKNYKSGSAIWRCKLYYTKMKCCGSITLKEDEIIMKKPHKCEPDFAKNILAASISNLKQKVTKKDKPIPQLFKKEMKRLADDGLDIVTNLPSFSSVQHSLYDMRNKFANINKTIYEKVEEVQVPAQFYKIILADYYYQGVRILLFCTPDVREEIEHIAEFFGDATFKACPPPFQELYSIHGDLGSCTETTKSKPLIFALLSDKKQSTYRLMFELIKSQLPLFRPKFFHCDFEVAAINALRLVYPKTNVIDCYYHWHRCMWRKATKIIGKPKCKAENRIVSLCSALPLLPKEMLLEGFQYILIESEHLSMQTFLKYVQRMWIKEKYINIISVFGMRHRTNNVLEGFHSKLNKVINKNNKTIMRLLNAIYNNSFMLPTKKKNKRRRCDITNDVNIRQIQMQLVNNEISVGYALEKLR